MRQTNVRIGGVSVAVSRLRIRLGRGQVLLVAASVASALLTGWSSSDAVAQTRRASAECIYALPATALPAHPLCIRAGSFNHDLCQAIAQLATASQLPPDFFARLIWRESRFRPDALSLKGARGIAQFMPATADLRGLVDSDDALQALEASARYLGDLKTRFGNLGLAAAAYNAGEQRLSNFLSSGSLPFETRSYVYGITGHSVEEWKSTAEDLPLPVLDDKRPFMAACTALAESRRLVEPADSSEGIWAPWGAQLAAAHDGQTARLLFQRAAAQLPESLAGEKPLIIRKRDRDFGFRPRFSARIGRAERTEAENTCVVVRRAGLPCLVFKNF